MLILASCSSPLDVDAKKGKKVVIGEKPFDIFTNTDTLDFGFVHPYRAKQKSFTIFNNTSKNFTVNTLSVKNSTSIIHLSNFSPTELKPKNKAGDEVEIEVSVNADDNSSYYSDWVIINGLEKPKVLIKAVIPAIYAEDIDFGETKISDDFIGSEFLTLQNLSDKTIVISDLIINDPAFKIKTNISEFQLAPDSSEDVIITFEPKEVRLYETELTFSVNDNTIISDKTVKISGTGSHTD